MNWSFSCVPSSGINGWHRFRAPSTAMKPLQYKVFYGGGKIFQNFHSANYCIWCLSRNIQDCFKLMAVIWKQETNWFWKQSRNIWRNILIHRGNVEIQGHRWAPYGPCVSLPTCYGWETWTGGGLETMQKAFGEGSCWRGQKIEVAQKFGRGWMDFNLPAS